MRVRSGHIVLVAGVVIVAMIAFVLMNAAPPTAPVSEGAPQATVPPQGTDPSLVPVMEVEALEKDLGMVSNKESSRHPYIIRNTGTAPLRIREVKTSCACTLGHLPEGGLIVPPKGEGTMEIEIFPNRIPGFEARRTLTLFSNDPHKLTLEIGITSHIDPEFSLDPMELNFGEVPKGSAPSLTMVLKQLQDAPVEVKEINTFGHVAPDTKEGAVLAALANEFTFQITKRPEAAWATPGKAEYELTVGLSPGIAAGSLEGKKVHIVTNVPRVPSLMVPLKGTVVAPYTLEPALPQKLNLRPDAVTNRAMGTVKLSAAEAIRVEDIQPQGDAIRVILEPTAVANQLTLTVEVTESAPAGPLEAEVLFNVVVGEKKYPERVGVRSFVVKK